MKPRTSRRLRLLSIGVAPLLAFAGVGLALAVQPTADAAAAGTLAAAAEGQNKYFGVAYTNAHSGDSAYTNIAGSEFDMVTPENEMKWDTTESSQNSFNFAPGQQVVDFAKSHNERVRGHTLVWHSQLPGWVSNLSGTAAQNAMTNHVTKEVTNYKGSIYAWDVVNEPFDDSGNYRQDVFYNAYGGGPQYVAAALRAARAADPDAKLYVNDYNIEGQGAKADAMYSLAQTLVNQGAPLDGIGFETHLAVQYGFPTNMQTNMQRFAALGLDVAVTELDVRMQLPADTTKNNTQQQYYVNVINACKAISRCVGWTVWGVSDDYSWVPNTFSGEGNALLWDSNKQKKPVYTAVLNAIGPPVSISPSSPRPSSASPSVVPSSASPSVVPSSASPSVVPSSVPPSSVPPSSNPPTGCSVTYTVVNQWPNGFQANVTVTNGSASRSSWQVSWTFPNGQTISQMWNGTYTLSGSTVTVRNLSYNGNLNANASTTFGFLGSWSGTNNPPSNITCQ